MRVFISGCAGFLGSHLADAMIASGHTVVGCDNLIGGDLLNLPPKVKFYKADCCDRLTMKRIMQDCEIVFHCAATPHEGLSVFSPYTITHNIVDASVSIFSAAISNNVKRIVFCSSMARYGELPLPYREDYLPRPQDPYGIAKVCAEDILINLCVTHGLDYVIAVPHNIIGPRQRYIDPFRNVASIMINLMLQGKQPIIYGDGNQMRCFSFIKDCVQSLRKMAHLKAANKQIINIGPDEESISINGLARTIADLLSFDLNPTYMPGRPQEVKRALCSSDKARELLDYKTETSLRDGLSEMIEYIKERGPKPFEYHLPLEIVNGLTPRTWTEKLF